MYLVNYNPETFQILGYIDPSLGFHGTDDGTAWFSVDNDLHTQYSQAPAWTDGKIITNIPPPSDFVVLTEEGWVEDDELVQKTLNASKDTAKHSIDKAVIAIYEHFNPFVQEYALRKEQALAFAEANYEGDVPVQVKAVSDPTGMTPQQAADSIINESKKLQSALERLGQLRMQKLAVDKMLEISDVNTHLDVVLKQISAIAAQL